MRASGMNNAFMQARSLSAGPVMDASIAAGIAAGSAGNAQAASGVCAIALPASAPVNIVAENSVRNILFSPGRIERWIITSGIVESGSTLEQKSRLRHDRGKNEKLRYCYSLVEHSDVLYIYQDAETNG
jgi:hypothetical protein